MAVPAEQALITGEEMAIASAMALLVHYYDLAPASARLLLNKWLQRCPAHWVRAAVIEALYQGRYRPVSVEQILAFWLRRSKMISHFNREFEMLIAVPIQQEFAAQQAQAIAELSRGQRPALQPLPRKQSALQAAAIVVTAIVEEEAETTTPSDTLPDSLQASASAPPQPSQSPAEFFQNLGPSSGQGSSSAETVPDLSAPHIVGPQEITVETAPMRERALQMHQPPIGQFTPAEDPSGFSDRLKEVAEQFPTSTLPAALPPALNPASNPIPPEIHYDTPGSNPEILEPEAIDAID